MKFKLLEKIDINNSEIEIAVKPDGTFWYNDGSGHPKLLTGEDLEQVQAEFERQEKLNNTSDKSDNNDDDRIAQGKKEFDPSKAVKQLIANAEEKQRKYRADLSKRPKKKSNFSKVQVNPSIKVIEDDIVNYIDNLIADKYEISKVVAKKPGFNPHDVYADEVTSYNSHGDRINGILMPAKNKKKVAKKTLVEKEIPYVLFYFDRSRSFEESEHPKKTQLGKDLLEMFSKYENGVPEDWVDNPDPDRKDDWKIPPNSIIVEKWAFGDRVEKYDGKYKEYVGPNGEATAANKVIEHIRDRSKGHLSNVVIVTDNHMNVATDSVEVDGGVWICLIGSDADNLEKHLRGDHIKTYLFKYGSEYFDLRRV